MTATADWYKDAIIYEVHVRAFRDSNGDGTGDFRGLTERLDYLQDLGITAIWLLPFYPSPRRDDGYDIADYNSVHPSYGTTRDFRRFLREAHRRDLRVITELVVNHTSDQHPWFQRARRAEPGSVERDFYVWSDTPDRYPEARIIFSDTETSNWAWDPVARAYYWHRFFSHQPDLNYDNPAVRKAIYQVLDYWLDMGVDGLRLDAVPYLFERDGTMCENLPETHAELKAMRAHIDGRYEGRMLLAEANQWPEDAAAYFGEDDEVQMAYHFPLMPRLFMAIRMENRFPIIDILEQTPSIPSGSQWALFLRNHDELTLEMVTDEERDYMYRTYAENRQARINLGIRRRLAPLLGNSRRQTELMNALLLSLPGTPVIYYGDEIGMGDNIYLGDRDGVRTPMQWSNDRNAGFSETNPQQLYLPVIIDSEYHYETVNVEAQERNSNSLLWWTRRMLALRRRHPVFGRGTIEFLHPENGRVLAFLRRDEEETMLVVANLARHNQYVELDLSEFRAIRPLELFGRTPFPPVGEQPYMLTLGPHSFYWFSLTPGPGDLHLPQWEGEREQLELSGGTETAFQDPLRGDVEALLARYIPGRVWYHGGDRKVRHARLVDVIPLRRVLTDTYLVLVEIEYLDGDPQRYLLPLRFAFGERATGIWAQRPESILCRVEGDAGGGIVYDAASSEQFAPGLAGLMGDRKKVPGELGELRASSTQGSAIPDGLDRVDVRALDDRQGHTSIMLGDQLVLKLLRRIEAGINPDLEIRRFLTEKTSFENLPAVRGWLEYQAPGEEATTLGIIQSYVPHEGEAWDGVTGSLGRLFETVLADDRLPQPDVPSGSLVALTRRVPPSALFELIAEDVRSAETLGTRTAELHRALASNDDDLDFRPEPFTTLAQRSLYQSLRGEVRQAFASTRRALARLPEETRSVVEQTVGREGELIERLRGLISGKIDARRIRLQGDFRLEEILGSGNDFVFFDFAGDTTRPMSERRLKQSPLRDVAELIRSYHYAALAGLEKQLETGPVTSDRWAELEIWATAWYRWVSAAFLRNYLQGTAGTGLVPSDETSATALLDAF
ncbi:MAG: maltose alpha-D-glucosyltransferase, partial [Acidimicrobiia bacterium]|nr:maltose alpha-D-glucosyltransferase [Acidimicrobiia bacterium]